MKFWEICDRAIRENGLYENAAHRSRFTDMMSCFSEEPFFNAGICKCMYLSAMDDGHMADLIGILNFMTAGGDSDDTDMKNNGYAMEEEGSLDDATIYRLSLSFLTNEGFDEKLAENCSDETKRIISQALKASDVIDTLGAN